MPEFVCVCVGGGELALWWVGRPVRHRGRQKEGACVRGFVCAGSELAWQLHSKTHVQLAQMDQRAHTDQ